MKKILTSFLVFLALMFFCGATFACENCDCDKNSKCNCECSKVCDDNCDCGCKKGEKCTCKKECKCKCGCKSKFAKFFKKNKCKCAK